MTKFNRMQLEDKNGNQINPATEDTLKTINTRMAKDAVRVEDRTTETNEFIASGLEVAFNSYTIDAGYRTIVKGELDILTSINIKGKLRLVGVLNVGI